MAAHSTHAFAGLPRVAVTAGGRGTLAPWRTSRRSCSTTSTSAFVPAGAARKQRRGEPLSAEEEEAIGRWQRLSLWRKFIAIGAFALGTFGLGFTVGGLIFGRWRAARR